MQTVCWTASLTFYVPCFNSIYNTIFKENNMTILLEVTWNISLISYSCSIYIISTPTPFYVLQNWPSCFAHFHLIWCVLLSPYSQSIQNITSILYCFLKFLVSNPSTYNSIRFSILLFLIAIFDNKGNRGTICYIVEGWKEHESMATICKKYHQNRELHAILWNLIPHIPRQYTPR